MMNETKPKHTPEPWIFDIHEGTFYIFTRDEMEMVADGDPDKPSIARMRGVGRGASTEEQEANAALIAASPDLLAACKSVLRFLYSVRPSEPDDPLRAIQDRIHGPYRNELEAAITKAEGE